MQGDFVNLVENTIGLSEEREDIATAISQAVDSLTNQFKGEERGFWSSIVSAINEKKPTQISDNLLFTPKGGLVIDKPIQLIDDSLAKLLAVEYESEESVKEFVKEVGEIASNIKNDELFSDTFVKNVDPNIVEGVKKAMLREVIATFLTKITINSKNVDKAKLKNIVQAAISV